MTPPLARPVALSASARLLNSHQPKPPNLPLTNYLKVSPK
jgi:hypothetical protein